MRTVRPGAQALARWRAFACGLVFLASCMIAASASAWAPQLSSLFAPALTPDPDSKLPAPTRYSYRETFTTVVFGNETPLRTSLGTTVPVALRDVLAFYRTELEKAGWQEKPDSALITADHVQIAYASPLGPGVLKLGRRDGSTMVSLVQKNASVASNANLMPEAGRAMLLFSNTGETEATLVIDDRTIKRAAGTRAVSLDLRPGKYTYEISVPGHPATTHALDLAAGDSWEVAVGHDGKPSTPFQLY